jgi:serine/threonine-protein kinase
MNLRRWGREALLIGAGIALAVLAGGLVLDVLVMPFVTRQGMGIRVPDVSGKTPAEAREILARARLKLQVEDERWSPGVPEGRIIYQRPGPSVGVKEGRTVYVSVSRGDRSCTVPDLTSGISLREARFRIEQAGLTVGRVEEVDSEAHPGLVAGQGLDPGSQAPRGAAVDLRVSRGQALPFQAPGLVGCNVDSAFALLDSLGLSPGRIEYREQPGVGTDTVLEQTPAAGTEVRAGDTVNLVVSQ